MCKCKRKSKRQYSDDFSFKDTVKMSGTLIGLGVVASLAKSIGK